MLLYFDFKLNMKKVLYVFIAFISIISFSCDDSVEMFVPGSDAKTEYVMNCVMNINADSQIVTISKSYISDPANPESYTDDPFISGAEITMVYKYFTFQFKETSMERTDTTRYKTQRKFYVAKTVPFMGGDSVKITAVLKNGKILKSALQVQSNPVVSKNTTVISNRRSTPSGLSTGFSWKMDPLKIKMYSPHLLINYQKFKNGVLQPEIYQKDIPSKLIKDGNRWVPIYYNLIRTNSATFDFNAMDSAMVEIEPDFYKRPQIKIINATFRILMYDEFLSQYYIQNNGYMDNVTVKIDENDYSNINGGLGIFGSYQVYNTTVYFERDYIYQFNYYVDPL